MEEKPKKLLMSVPAEELAIKDTVSSLRILLPLVAVLQVILIVTWCLDLTGDRAAWGSEIYVSGYVYMLLASIGMAMLLSRLSKDIPKFRTQIYHMQMTYAWMLPIWTAVLTTLDAVNASPTFGTQFYVIANVLTMGICYMSPLKWTLIEVITGLAVFISGHIMPVSDPFTFLTELASYIVISIIVGRLVFKMKIKGYEHRAELAKYLKRVEYDSLTGVYTREAFYNKVEELLKKNPDISYTLIASDIDNFKQINSIFGMEKANEVLCYMAESFCKHGKITARYGADQFIAIFPASEKMTEQELDAEVTATAKGAPIDNLVVKYGYYDVSGEKIPVSVMCDRALLAAKSIHYNYTRKVACYNGPVSQRQLRAKKYALDFREAIERKEFLMWYQPKVDPYQGKIVAAEALVRWKKEDGYISPPADFLDVFEENGQIIELDEYVFRTVCMQQKRWLDSGKEIIPISINLSRKSMTRPDLVTVYKKIVEETGAPIEMVPLEITESAAIRSLMIQPIVQKLYESGFHIHMDDFGSGQSSINGLNLLNVDVVKIDKSLVDTIGTRSGNTILGGLIGIIRELGLRIVAEGVEEKEQLDFLMANHVDEIQGYYYSRPLPLEEYVAKMVSGGRFG